MIVFFITFARKKKNRSMLFSKNILEMSNSCLKMAFIDKALVIER